MRRLAAIVAGRRTKWFVLVGWIVLLFALAPLGSKLGDVTDDQTQSFLPKNAESTKVVNLLEKDFPGGQTVNGLVVYQRSGGLTAADKAKIAADAERAKSALPLVGAPAVPFQPGAPRALVARGGAVAYVALNVPDNQDKLATWGKRLNRIVGNGSSGLHVYLTGALGFNTDAEEVFGSIDTQLLLVTVVLVLVLLGLIYRSPVVALIPLLVVGLLLRGGPGLHLPLRQVRRHGLLQLDQHPGGPHVRSRHRLLPAPGLPLPRGAAAPRGQARRDAARRTARGPGDPGQRPDRLAVDARAAGGRVRLDPLARTGRRRSASPPSCSPA